METRIEFGGFVWNRETKEYELVFKTEMSALLARNRAKESAEFQNQGGAAFDTQSIIVKKREVLVCPSPWEDIDGPPVGKHRRRKIERDIDEARRIILDGLLRYKKKKIGARSKTHAADLAKAFTDLEPYGDEEGIADAYAYEEISDTERHRLLKLCEARKEAQKNEGIYQDRVIEILERAICRCGDEFGLD